MIDKKKKSKVHFCTLIISVLIMFALITMNAVAARAAAGPYTVSATLSPNLTIVVDGVEKDFYNVSGKEVHPIVYNGTTYLPLRAIGELMGKNVNWDQSLLTVTLAGSRSTPPVTGIPDSSADVQSISVQIRPDFTIVMDSKIRTFADASGSQVYPMLYNGTTYLPLRAVGSLMGKEVSWDGATKTVTLISSENSGNLVTDADSFNNSGEAAGSYIGEEKAKAIALSHAAEIAAGQVDSCWCKLEQDEGYSQYCVKFISNNIEYEYHIDAYNGEIYSYKHNNMHYNDGSSGNTGQYIGEAKAKEIALSHAGVSADSVYSYKCKFDWDNDRAEYDIEFKSGGYEYEIEIDASAGNVLKYEKERD